MCIGYIFIYTQAHYKKPNFLSRTHTHTYIYVEVALHQSRVHITRTNIPCVENHKRTIGSTPIHGCMLSCSLSLSLLLSALGERRIVGAWLPQRWQPGLRTLVLPRSAVNIDGILTLCLEVSRGHDVSILVAVPLVGRQCVR